MIPTSSTPTPSCLGLLLSTREVGIAVVTREHLLFDGVINLRKIPSREGREARFRQAVSQKLDRFPVARMAVTTLRALSEPSGLLLAERAWLAEECTRRGLTFRTYEREVIHRDPMAPSRWRTHRLIAETLCQRFPELRPKAPSCALTPSSGLPGKDRYWLRMFAALAIALHDLDQALLERLNP